MLSHLSDDFADVARDGKVYHRSDIEAGWPDVTLKGYKLSDCIFKLMIRDAAYLSCMMEVDATYKGQLLICFCDADSSWELAPPTNAAETRRTEVVRNKFVIFIEDPPVQESEA